MSAPRVVVIGGGSQFSVGLCESFVDYGHDMLAGATVVLLDIDLERAETVRDFSRALAEKVGANISFEASEDRRAAFQGADYILTTFRPGTHAQLRQDERVPVSHGLQGNETVGIGGIFMACRVVPVLRAICADAEEVCPQATIVNYTNPTQFVGDAIQRVSKMRSISLCDGYIDLMGELRWLLDRPEADVQLTVAGTNHAMWVMDFTVDGEPGYPLLRERLEEIGSSRLAEMVAPPERVRMFDLDFDASEIYPQFRIHYAVGFNLELFGLYGVLPGPPYYWRYLLDQDAIIAAQRSPDYVTMADFYTKHLQPRMFEGLEERVQTVAAHLSEQRRKGGGGHGDLAVRVIAAMAADSGERFVVNVRNDGAVANLPDDAILELSATIDRSGAHPIAVGELPPELLGLQQALVLSQQLAVGAAISGDREELLKAILAHPLISSERAARATMEELLELQADWLPQFHEPRA